MNAKAIKKKGSTTRMSPNVRSLFGNLRRKVGERRKREIRIRCLVTMEALKGAGNAGKD